MGVISPAAPGRIRSALAKLAAHGLREFAVTGSVALQGHLGRVEPDSFRRRPHDLDIVVDGLASIPGSVARGFLARHIHAASRPGRLLLQLVDEPLALRIDIFTPFGASLARTRSVRLEGGDIRVMSPEDLAARLTSLLMDLAAGTSVAAKHARDFDRLLPLVDFDVAADIWSDYRKPGHPREFGDAVELIGRLTKSSPHLLAEPQYSRDIDAVCPHCRETPPFTRASGKAVMSILGYC